MALGVPAADELDALVDRKMLSEMYRTTASEKHACRLTNLFNERDPTFYKNIETVVAKAD